MATNALMLSIPNPCSENWNNMTPHEKGRFCDTCQKCVVDFTVMPDAAVLDYFNKNNGRVCGRFSKRQLDRVLIINDKRFQKRFNIAASLLLLSSLGFGNTVKNDAVLPLKISQFDSQKWSVKKSHEQLSESVLTDSITIKGSVFTLDTPNESLIGASIILKGSKIGVVTDEKGDFTFTLPLVNVKDTTLIVSFVGFETREIKLSEFTKTESLKIELQPLTLGETIIVGGVHRRPNLWKRFTNLFRRKGHKKW
jgi:CarboxypepD_reg-like domain